MEITPIEDSCKLESRTLSQASRIKTRPQTNVHASSLKNLQATDGLNERAGTRFSMSFSSKSSLDVHATYVMQTDNGQCKVCMAYIGSYTGSYNL